MHLWMKYIIRLYIYFIDGYPWLTSISIISSIGTKGPIPCVRTSPIYEWAYFWYLQLNQYMSWQFRRPFWKGLFENFIVCLIELLLMDGKSTSRDVTFGLKLNWKNYIGPDTGIPEYSLPSFQWCLSTIKMIERRVSRASTLDSANWDALTEGDVVFYSMHALLGLARATPLISSLWHPVAQSSCSIVSISWKPHCLYSA